MISLTETLKTAKQMNDTPVILLAEALTLARDTLDLIHNHARVCIVSTEEECDMGANWVQRRCVKALAEISKRVGP